MGMPAQPKTKLKAAWLETAASPAPYCFDIRKSMSWVSHVRDWQQTMESPKAVPSPSHWDRIDQIVTYKSVEKNQPNLQCALSLVPLPDSDLSTLFPFKEFKINLMIAFK